MSSNRVSQSIEQALNRLEREHVRVQKAIAKLERQGVRSKDVAVAPSAKKAVKRSPIVRAQARSRAGWTDEARTQAAERMRSWWASQKEEGRAPARRSRIAPNKSKRTARRSTAGWTHEKRADAAERMKAYWDAQRTQRGQ